MKTFQFALIMVACTISVAASAAGSEEDWNFTDGSITVTVVDEHDEPQPNLEVRCAADRYGGVPEPPVYRQTTGPDGKCTFSQLPSESYLLHVESNTHGAWARLKRLGPDKKHVEATLKLDVYYSIRGIVRDIDGKPLPAVKVLVRSGMPAAVTGEDGRFEIRNVPGDMRMMFFLVKEGYGSVRTSYALPRQSLDITMFKGGRLKVTVMSAEGIPAAEARVWYTTIGEAVDVGVRLKTDGEGKFSTVWLPAGREVELNAWQESDGTKLAAAEKTVLLAAGSESQTTVQLEPYTTPPTTYISGQVVMAETRKPVSARIMQGDHWEWIRVSKTHTDHGGRFVLDDLPLGKLYITALPDDHTLYPAGGLMAIDLSDGQPVEDLTIEVAQGCAVRGKVLSADGLPVPEKFVSYCLRVSNGTQRVPGFTHTVQSGKDGRFEIPSLPCVGDPFELSVDNAHALVGPLRKGQVSEEVVLQLKDVFLKPVSETYGIKTRRFAAASRWLKNLFLKPRSETIIRGRIEDVGGNPIEGARIQLRERVQVETDRQGRFEFPRRFGRHSRLRIAIDGKVVLDRSLPDLSRPGRLEYSTENLQTELVISDNGLFSGTVREPPRLVDSVEGRREVSRASGVHYVEGDPIARAVVAVITPHEAEPVISRGDGSFELAFHKSGIVRFDVLVPTTVYVGNQIDSLTQDVTLIDNDFFTIEERVPVNGIRIVGKVEPARFVAGTILNEEGNPVNAEAYFWQEQLMGTVSVRNGRFIKTDLRDGAVLLEFCKEGYQAALLESERDFNVGDRNIRVVMKEGPFPEETNVFTAVTGYEDSDEGISQLLRGENLRKRTGSWERLAKKGEEERQQQYEIYVTDAEGNLLNRIWVEEATTYNQPLLTRETAVVDQRSEREILSSDDGQYMLRELPWRMPWKRSVWISAEGTARALFLASEYDPEQAPVHITLRPASKITIRVVDFDGDPVPGLAVGAAARSSRHISSNFYYLPKTDVYGTVVFDKLSPGLYDYRIHYVGKTLRESSEGMPMPPRFVAFRVESGTRYERTVQFGPPRRGTAEAVLYTWEQEFKKREWREKIGTAPRKLRESVRRDLAGLITGRMDELVGRYHFEDEEAAMLAVAAERYGLKEAIPAIQGVLSRWYISPVQMIQADNHSQMAVLAIVELAGDNAVDFFVSTATDRVYPYWIRSLSLVALGQIGTEKSVDAFVRLRDAAYGTRGAPGRKQQYTHEEKMAETLEMVFNVIAWEPESEDDTVPMVTAPEKAAVSEDGTTGIIGCSFNRQGATRIHMKRFGDEWLIVRIGYTVIS